MSHNGNVSKGAKPGHKNGWGILAYKNNAILDKKKSPTDAYSDKNYYKIANKVSYKKTDLILAHLRKASVGNSSIANTHPFIYKKYAFAHNGTIFNSEKIPLKDKYKKLLKGTTDSEKFFFYLIQLFEENKKNRRSMVSAIKKAILFSVGKLDYFSLTFLLTDGKFLWALRKYNSGNNQYRKYGFKKYYTLFEGVNDISKGKIISSEKIASHDLKWKLFHNNELRQINLKTGEEKIINI